ncbi:general transcription factor II-I repeat domain-containing protein 2A-like [Hydra vulgaris]|uniref:General transcription factor II-I repeat domain-containing protein 2A-like n=1 Tax=Hydra vulgaris TaxID=6087 RepID=A0ABM4BPK8_HYDVU
MASAKRRRCDTESGHGGRVFNPSWTTDYFVHEQSQFRIDKIKLLKKTFLAQQSVMKTKVISSYSATKISFLMAEAIAKSGKPFCTGDLLKNCLKIFCKEICPEKTPTVEDLNLSHQTIARRVEDLSKNIELSLKEKLNKCEAYSLALDESTDRSDTAQLAIFIREKKLCGVTTDGASALTGKNIGFVALLKKSINHEIISYHCIIHQEQLCAKVLEMKNVMELVIHTVNFIRSHGLNHRQFKQLLEGCGSEAENVIYFSQVRWLSRAAILKRFWILLPEIVLFLRIKEKDTSLLENIDCLNDLAFLIDMTQMLMELNLKLQGKDQLISKLFENVETFVLKLKLLKQQLSSKVLVYFKALLVRNIYTIDSERYCTLILKLIDEFDTRFCDFKKEKNELDLFAHSFSIKAETVRNEFQIHAIKYFSLFGSTYNCEQLFSKLKHVKTELRNRLTDEHLTNTLRIASSSIKADIDHLCKKKQCQKYYVKNCPKAKRLRVEEKMEKADKVSLKINLEELREENKVLKAQLEDRANGIFKFIHT